MDSLSDQIFEMVRVVAPRVADRLSDIWSYPLLTAPDDRLYSVYLISFLLIGLAVYFVQNKKLDLSPSAILAFLIPKDIYLNRSAIVDYKYYVVNRIISRILSILYFGFSFIIIGDFINEELTLIFGRSEVMTCEACVGPLLFVYGITLFVVFDFSLFISHHLHHRVPILWEFHKVHHSAGVLTPVTTKRFHPGELIIRASIVSALTGIVNGIFGYLLAERLAPSEYLTISFLNIGIMAFAVNLFANLRHSHIWLSYGYVLSHILISPAQHQIHHSCESRHFDKNLGIVFSVWDWMWGSLYVPRSKESFAIGLLHGEHEEYDGVIKLYALPFQKAAHLVFRRKKLTDRARD
jgi:sterol desaturase/sphingolipid hydroxylase (fatty acid hydroxylase superfamily)